MFKKDKKIHVLETLLPKRSESHKKRNALIVVGSAVVAAAIAAVSANKDDSQ